MKAKEQAKEKAKVAKQGGSTKWKLRRKYVATLDTDEETEDTSQFIVVSHPPKSKVDRICENIRNHVDISKLEGINFGQLTKEEKNKIEESIYSMMAKFKTTPLELDNTMPKELYSLIENKWHYCLNLEKEIRESTLENLFPDFKRIKITKKVQKYRYKF